MPQLLFSETDLTHSIGWIPCRAQFEHDTSRQGQEKGSISYATVSFNNYLRQFDHKVFIWGLSPDYGNSSIVDEGALVKISPIWDYG